MRRAITLAMALAFAVLPAAAHGAVVDAGPPFYTGPVVDDGEVPHGYYPTRELTFTASVGERNSLRVTREGAELVFRDRGAVLGAAGFGCRRGGRHTVRCRFSRSEASPYYADNLVIRTHAGNDRMLVKDWVGGEFFATIRTGTGEDRVRVDMSADVYSGPGNDVIVLNDVEDTSLDCGAGRDRWFAVFRPGLDKCERRLRRAPF